MSNEPKTRNHSLARGHEERDVALRPIVLSAIALAIGIVLAVGGMRLLFVHNLDREAEMSPPANPLAAASGPRLPPEPRLLPKPIEQLEQLRIEENETLTTYGWVDRDRGAVRLPIERAMDLIAQRGLPQAKPLAPAAPQPAAPAAEAP